MPADRQPRRRSARAGSVCAESELRTGLCSAHASPSLVYYAHAQNVFHITSAYCIVTCRHGPTTSRSLCAMHFANSRLRSLQLGSHLLFVVEERKQLSEPTLFLAT